MTHVTRSTVTRCGSFASIAAITMGPQAPPNPAPDEPALIAGLGAASGLVCYLHSGEPPTRCR